MILFIENMNLEMIGNKVVRVDWTGLKAIRHEEVKRYLQGL